MLSIKTGFLMLKPLLCFAINFFNWRLFVYITWRKWRQWSTMINLLASDISAKILLTDRILKNILVSIGQLSTILLQGPDCIKLKTKWYNLTGHFLNTNVIGLGVPSIELVKVITFWPVAPVFCFPNGQWSTPFGDPPSRSRHSLKNWSHGFTHPCLNLDSQQ